MVRTVRTATLVLAMAALIGAAWGQGWQLQPIERGTKPALAVTEGGQPSIVYMLERAEGWVRIATLTEDGWRIETAASGYFYGPPDIAMGLDGVLHATYHDHQDLSVSVRTGDAAYVTEVEGRLVSRAARDSGHDGWDARIVVDAAGGVHLSGIDPVEFGGVGVEYYALRDNGSWEVEAVGSGPQTYKYATSVAVLPDGTPLVSYYDGVDDDLILASRGADGWQLEAIDSEGDTGLFSHMAVDADGGIHLSYFERRDRSAGVVRYAYRPESGARWQHETVDQLTNLFFGFTGARNITSIEIDSGGSPWIAFSDEAVLKVARRVEGVWQIETVLESDPATEPLGQIVSLRLDGEDRPHLAYSVITDKASELDGAIWYATKP
jgi:hypothetical protein